MVLLAIDTSGDACAIALATAPDATPVTAVETVRRAHNERLTAMIRDVMAGAGVAFADLDRIAVTVGPGSFTGLRVGIAAARGLALATGHPLVGVGNLAIHAASARALAPGGPLLAVTAAGRGDLYGQWFAADAIPSGPPRAALPEDFAAECDASAVLAGSGADAVAALAGGRVVHRLHAPDLSAFVALAAATDPSGAAVKPLYLRPPDAKPQAAAAVARL